MPIDDDLLAKADEFAVVLEQRLNCHIGDRVDPSPQKHWTLDFTHDNVPPMAAAMCLAGHIVDNLETFSINEYLLCLPMNAIFHIVSGDLSQLEGCYL